jgi:hypothetical protein
MVFELEQVWRAERVDRPNDQGVAGAQVGRARLPLRAIGRSR